MKKLNKEKLMETNGGAISLGSGLGIVGGLIFLIGLIDGIVRPLPCLWRKHAK